MKGDEDSESASHPGQMPLGYAVSATALCAAAMLMAMRRR
jgi:hypothetical protein